MRGGRGAVASLQARTQQFYKDEGVVALFNRVIGTLVRLVEPRA